DDPDVAAAFGAPSSIGRWQLAQLSKRIGATSRLKVIVRAAVFSGSPAVREQAARATIAMATSDWYRMRSKAIFRLALFEYVPTHALQHRRTLLQAAGQRQARRYR